MIVGLDDGPPISREYVQEKTAIVFLVFLIEYYQNSSRGSVIDKK